MKTGTLDDAGWAGTLNEPEGVAVDATGRVIVADTQDNQMVVMRPDRTVESTVNGLHTPTAVEVGPTGTIYLADTYADVVRIYTITDGPPPDTTAPVGAFSTPGLRRAGPGRPDDHHRHRDRQPGGGQRCTSR